MPLRYRFTHALIQHGLYQDLGAGRRQRAHLRVAQVLEDGVDRRTRRPSSRGTGSPPPAPPTSTPRSRTSRPPATTRSARSRPRTPSGGTARPSTSWIGKGRPIPSAKPGCSSASAPRNVTSVTRRSRRTLLDAGRLAQDAGQRRAALRGRARVRPRRWGGRARRIRSGSISSRPRSPPRGEDDLALRARLLGAAIEVMNANDADALFERAGEAIALAEASGDERALLAVLCSTYAARSWPETRAQRRIDVARGMELAERARRSARAGADAGERVARVPGIGRARRGRRRVGRPHPAGRRDRARLPEVGRARCSSRSGRCCAATSPRRSGCPKPPSRSGARRASPRRWASTAASSWRSASNRIAKTRSWRRSPRSRRRTPASRRSTCASAACCACTDGARRAVA